MTQLRLWLAGSLVLIFLAGAAIGAFVALQLEANGSLGERGSLARRDGMSPTQAAYWRDWIAATPELWAELGLGEETQAQLGDEAERLVEEDGRLRRDLLRVAESARESLFAALDAPQRDKARAILARYDNPFLVDGAVRETEHLAREIQLQDAQLVAVYRIIYDSHRQRFEAWSGCREKEKARGVDRGAIFKELTKQVGAIYAARDERMGALLSAPQLEAYRKWVEEKRRHGPPGSGGRRGSKDKDERGERRGDEHRRDGRREARPDAEADEPGEGASSTGAPSEGATPERRTESPSNAPGGDARQDATGDGAPRRKAARTEIEKAEIEKAEIEKAASSESRGLEGPPDATPGGDREAAPGPAGRSLRRSPGTRSPARIA